MIPASTKVQSYQCDRCGRIRTLQIIQAREGNDICDCGGKLMAGLTVEKVKEVDEHLKNNQIKPWFFLSQGWLGLGPNGIFEIQSEEQFERLKNDQKRMQEKAHTHNE